MSPLAHSHSATLPHCDPQQGRAFGILHVGGTASQSQATAHADLSPDARELAQEIDRYKFRHRRRFINYEEILTLVKTLGYRKETA